MLASYVLGILVASTASAGVHEEHDRLFGAEGAAPMRPARAAPPRPPPTPGPDRLKVYGYLAYWSDDLDSVPWDELTHIAIFSAGATSTGGLTSTDHWDIAADAVAMAAPYGVKVHLVVTNFSSSEQTTLLGNAAYRNALIDQLVDWKAATGADGINIDFESLPSSRRNEMLTFVEDLEAAVGEVVLATPAVDWSGAWDYSELSKHADLFIMGYDYFWTGSSYAGPSDPLDAGSGTVWSGVNSYSIGWTLDDYLTYDADPDRVILGLPFYGRSWPTAGNGVPTATQGSGSTLLFADGWDLGAVHGVTYEPDSAALYSFDGARQYWYGDVSTVQERIVYARDVAGVSGIGFWALHYDDDDPLMWAMIHDESTTPSTGGTTTEEEPTDTGTPGGTTGGTDPGTTPSTGGTSTNGTTDRTPGTLDGPPLGSNSLTAEPKSGCGCASTSGSAGWLGLLGLQLIWRARRTPSQASPRPTTS